MAHAVNLEFLNKMMKKMANDEKIFQNEAQFQFDLAWEIRNELSTQGYQILLERWTNNEQGKKQNGKAYNKKSYTDIVVHHEKEGDVAIELKYKMTDKDCKNRKFPKQEAQDLGKYDFLLDVSRNERLLKEKTVLGYKFIKGYAIILTNDHLYWHVATNHDYQYEEFRIDNGVDKNNDSLPVKVLAGTKSWSWKNGVVSNSVGGRIDPIVLDKDYIGYWKRYDYCKESCDSCKNIFKYLIFETK